MFEERQRFPKKDYGAAYFRGKNYRETYEICFKEFIYDFRLNDQSLLLFLCEGHGEHEGSLSYSYYDAPCNVMPYNEFVQIYDSPEQVDDLKAINLYDQYLATVGLSSNVTPLRYDYRARDYRSGIHPASHMHFGFNNDIRVGTNRILNPISFLLFILRQRYPNKWEEFLNMKESECWCRNIRHNVQTINASYWGTNDKLEMSLH